MAYTGSCRDGELIKRKLFSVHLLHSIIIPIIFLDRLTLHPYTIVMKALLALRSSRVGVAIFNPT